MHHPGPRLEFDTRTDIELDALLASQIKSMRVDDMALSPDCTVRIAHRSHEGTVEIRIRIDLPFDDAAALAAPGVLGICVRRRLIEGWTGRPLAAFTITAGLARLAIDARVETSSASSFVRMVVDAVSDLPFASSELQLAYGAVARRMDIDRLTIDEVALLELRTRMFAARSMEAMTDSVRHLASHAATDVAKCSLRHSDGHVGASSSSATSPRMQCPASLRSSRAFLLRAGRPFDRKSMLFKRIVT